MSLAYRVNLKGRKIVKIFMILFIILTLLGAIPLSTSAATTDSSTEETNIESPAPTRSTDYDKLPVEPESEPAQQTVTRALVVLGIEEGQDVNQVVRVGPGDQRNIFYNCYVHLQKQLIGKNVEQIWVELNVETDDPKWLATVSPPIVMFPYRNNPNLLEETFSLMIAAPFRAAASEQSHDIIISAYYTANPTSISGNAEPLKVAVTAMPFPDLILDSLDPLKQVSPGQEVDFILQVHNRGNDYDDFMIRISNIDFLNRNGWTVLLEESVIHDIAPWTFKNVTVHVIAPQRFTLWKNQVMEIEIEVKSINAQGSDYEEYGTKTYGFFQYERGAYVPPEPAIGITVTIIIIVVGAIYYRKWMYKRMEDESEGETEDEVEVEVVEEPDD
jgi:hypothetical protein